MSPHKALVVLLQHPTTDGPVVPQMNCADAQVTGSAL